MVDLHKPSGTLDVTPTIVRQSNPFSAHVLRLQAYINVLRCPCGRRVPANAALSSPELNKASVS